MTKYELLRIIETLEDLIIKAQDDTSLNIYYSMAQYLKQRVKELRGHMDTPHQDIEKAYIDLDWSIHYLQWLVKEQPKKD